MIKGAFRVLVFPASQGAEMIDNIIDSAADVLFLQQVLSQGGILHESLGDGIAHDVRVRSPVEEFPHLGDKVIRKSEEDGFYGFTQSQALGSSLLVVKGLRVDRKDPSIRIRFVFQPFNEPDPA